jgi:hypothetical protein
MYTNFQLNISLTNAAGSDLTTTQVAAILTAAASTVSTNLYTNEPLIYSGQLVGHYCWQPTGSAGTPGNGD